MAGFAQLSEYDPEGMVVGSDGFLYLDFGGRGLWRWIESAGFDQINGVNPRRITIS